MREKLSITPLAAVFTVVSALVGTVGCTQASDVGTQCADTACFSQHFSDCDAATYTTESVAGGQASYQILGSSNAGCRVQMHYTSNPNPTWVDKPLTFVINPGKPFEPQMKKALQTCLIDDKPGSYECSGPLHGIAGSGAGGPGAASGASDNSSTSQAATGSPCGKTVDVAGEPLFALPRDGKWGYVNRAGDWVIEPQWRQAEPFSEGRAMVDDGSAGASAWGIIDRHGDYVLKPGIRSHSFSTIDGMDVGDSPIKPFSQGCAAAVGPSSDDDPYFVTRDGKFWLRDALPAALADWDVREYGSFSEGLAWFRLFPEEFGKPLRYGWIDTEGALAIEPEYEGAGDFVGGLAPADSRSDSWGYINPKGELVWPHKWTLSDAQSFSSGLARISMKRDQSAYFDGKDVVIDEVQFESPRTLTTTFDGDKTFDKASLKDGGAFADGLAQVRLALSPYPVIFIDTQGKAVFAPGLDFGMEVCDPRHNPGFVHGLARLRVANKGAECDDERSRVGESRYFTYKQSHYIYIDTQGQVVLEEVFKPADQAAQL